MIEYKYPPVSGLGYYSTALIRQSSDSCIIWVFLVAGGMLLTSMNLRDLCCCPGPDIFPLAWGASRAVLVRTD